MRLQVAVHFGICMGGQGSGQQPRSLGVLAAEPLQGYLGVRRRVTKTGRSEFSICTVSLSGPASAPAHGAQHSSEPAGTAAAATASAAGETFQGRAEAGAEGCLGQAAASHWELDLDSCGGRWQVVPPDTFQKQLAVYGIQTQAIDR